VANKTRGKGNGHELKNPEARKNSGASSAKVKYENLTENHTDKFGRVELMEETNYSGLFEFCAKTKFCKGKELIKKG